MAFSRGRACVLAVVLATLVLSIGCASVKDPDGSDWHAKFNPCAYFHNRWRDFSQMADIGVTWSDTNQFVFYTSFESVLPLGYAHFDGNFAGWGGGQFGATRNSLDAWGAIAWGHEKVGWEDFDVNAPSTLYTQTVGLIGMPVGLFGDSNPNYVPS